MLSRIEDVPEDVLRPDDMDTGAVIFNVHADMNMEDVFKKRNDVVEAFSLGRDLKRLHQISFDTGGRTAVVSYGIEQV